MNKKQKIVLIAGVIIIFALLIYVTMMFDFIYPQLSMNIPRLLAQGVGFLIAWGLLVFVLKD